MPSIILSAIQTLLVIASLMLISFPLLRAGQQQNTERILPPAMRLELNEGFCEGGAPANVLTPADARPTMRTWGSACPGPMNTKTRARSTVFPAPEFLQLYISGYPSFPEIGFWLEDVSDGSRFAIVPHELPKERWLFYEFELPPSWKGKQVRLLAEDGRVNKAWWIGFSEPLNFKRPAGWKESASILLRALEHFLLLVLPPAAICLFAVKKGVRDPVIAGAITLASTAVPGYFVFWLSLLWQSLGHALAFLIPIAAIILSVMSGKRLERAGLATLKALLVPFLLVAALSLFVLSAGFVYGGLNTPFATAANRFSHPLPPDNTLPFLVADGVRNYHARSLLIGDWKSSDRPPLQSGVALAQYPFTPRPLELGYTVVSVLLQSLWIAGLWLLLLALKINAKAISLTLLLCASSGFVLVNTFYVWPKLLAAGYLLGFFALLFSGGLRRGAPSGVLGPVVAGALLALSLQLMEERSSL